MPRYFFHQIHKGERIPDDRGIDLSDLGEAREEALAGALEIMADRLWQNKEPNHSRFEICDSKGAVLTVVPFSDALKSLREV